MKNENIIKQYDQPRFYQKSDLKKQIPLNDPLLPIAQSGIVQFQMQIIQIEIDDNQVYGITLNLNDQKQKMQCNVKPLETFYQLVKTLQNENFYKQNSQIQFQTLDFEIIRLDSTLKQYLQKEQTEFILTEKKGEQYDEIIDQRIELFFVLKEGQNEERSKHFFNPDTQILQINQYVIQAFGIREQTQTIQMSCDKQNLDKNVFHKTLRELNIKSGQSIDVKKTSIAGNVVI
ncbi:hypothetical protein pb186bvf_007271 [Paramecium bursaria]